MRRFLALFLAFISVANVSSYAIGDKDKISSLSVQKISSKKLSFDAKVAGGAAACGVVVCLAGYFGYRYRLLSRLEGKFKEFYKWYHIIDKYKKNYDAWTNQELDRKLCAAALEIGELLEHYDEMFAWFTGNTSGIIILNNPYSASEKWKDNFDVCKSSKYMSLNKLLKLSKLLDKHIYILSHVKVPDVMPMPAAQ